MEIKQGATQTFTAHDVVDGDGNPINDWTGWSAHGMARAGHTRGPLLGEWHSSPTGAQQPVTLAPGSGSGGKVAITVTPAMSSAWTMARAVVHVKITSPAGQVARIIAEECDVSPDAVT